MHACNGILVINRKEWSIEQGQDKDEAYMHATEKQKTIWIHDTLYDPTCMTCGKGKITDMVDNSDWASFEGRLTRRMGWWKEVLKGQVGVFASAWWDLLGACEQIWSEVAVSIRKVLLAPGDKGLPPSQVSLFQDQFLGKFLWGCGNKNNIKFPFITFYFYIVKYTWHKIYHFHHF